MGLKKKKKKGERCFKNILFSIIKIIVYYYFTDMELMCYTFQHKGGSHSCHVNIFNKIFNRGNSWGQSEPPNLGQGGTLYHFKF